MPHDTTKAEMWYHDAIMPTCIIENWIHCIIGVDMSVDEIRLTAEKILVETKRNRAILYEEYLEKRRQEGVT